MTLSMLIENLVNERLPGRLPPPPPWCCSGRRFSFSPPRLRAVPIRALAEPGR
jgi:hypothetical protein